MNRIIKKSILTVIFGLTLFLVPTFFSQAATPDKVSVFHADGTVFSSKPLVFETNILPGDEFRRGFFVKKKDKFDQVLLMRFKRKLTSKQNILARKINVRLKRVSDQKFLRFPNGRTMMSLAGLYAYRDPGNSDAFRFDKIYGPAGSKHEYELVFEFSPKAGNRFQGRKTQFDLSVGIFSKPTGSCRDCFCFWRDFCCHKQDWHCRWVGYFFDSGDMSLKFFQREGVI